MDNEIRAAVDWWAERLARNEFQDNGDDYQSVFATLVASETDVPNERQLQMFRDILTASIKAKITGAGSWNVDEPMWGACTEGRCIGVDYGPEPLLRDAATSAGINTNRFPIKTCMWISPGTVKVSHGYRAQDKQIYPPVPDFA